MELNKIYNMDCLEGMKLIPDNSVDAIITDPPYELGFMGKSWDKTGIATNVEMWKECLRVLKSGGYLLAFSGTRTYHRMTSAIEDAGFEIRDMIEWVYGSGFPKSLNIGKAVDKLQGNEREEYVDEDFLRRNPDTGQSEKGIINKGLQDGEKAAIRTKGTSEWEGWGTALKPAHEPICMARKPLAEKTVAENVLKYGTGGINIDGSRIEAPNEDTGRNNKSDVKDTNTVGNWGMKAYNSQGRVGEGRFPANLIHDGSPEVTQCFPDSDGAGGSLPKVKITGYGDKIGNGSCNYFGGDRIPFESGSGNASRFFKSIIYTAKASSNERNAGLEGFPKHSIREQEGNISNRDLSPEKVRARMVTAPQANIHPTVKPIELIEYLINMVTKEGQTVLDPFAGSGTTLIVSKKLKRNFIGIEICQEYIDIIKARVNNVKTSQNIFNEW